MGGIAIVMLMLLGIVGCGASETDTTPSSRPLPTTSGPSSEPTPTDETRRVALGETVETPRGSSVRVYSIGPATRSTAPPDGAEWTSVDMEFCITPTLESTVNITNIRREFVLELEDGTILAPDGSAAEVSERFSDDELIVRAGDCVRGPVVFSVPDGSGPTTYRLVTPFGNLEWPLDP